MTDKKNDNNPGKVQLEEGFNVQEFATNMSKGDPVVLKKSFNVSQFADNMSKVKPNTDTPAPPPEKPTTNNTKDEK